MLHNIFIKAFAAGFFLSMPIGPVNLLCIRRTLAGGWAAGFASGLGAATADTLYGFVAAFGISFIINFLTAEKALFELGGGLFLCYLGARTYLHVPKEKTKTRVGRGLPRAYTVAFLLTLSNPATVLSLMAVFAGLGIAGQSRELLSSVMLVLGILTGAALWWLTLCSLVSLFRHKFTDQGIRWLNRISGAFIMAFGILTLFYLIRHFHHFHSSLPSSLFALFLTNST